MGDFDRVNTSAKPNETKKMIVVLALGLLLVGLVAMQYMKHSGPQSAMGAPTNTFSTLSSPVVNEELSALALAGMLGDLQKDPTASLLPKIGPTAVTANAIPRNPFRMSRNWYSYLAPEAPQATAPIVASTQPRPITISTPPLQPVPLRVEDYKITGIMGNMAVVNGKIVQIGAIIGRARVVEIRQNAVLLQPIESHTAPTIELTLIASALNPD